MCRVHLGNFHEIHNSTPHEPPFCKKMLEMLWLFRSLFGVNSGSLFLVGCPTRSTLGPDRSTGLRVHLFEALYTKDLPEKEGRPKQ